MLNPASAAGGCAIDDERAHNDKIKEDFSLRKELADKAGFDFKLASVAPIVAKKTVGETDGLVASRFGWSPHFRLVRRFVKFDIFGSFLELGAQRGRTKGLNGFFFIARGILRSGTEVNRGTEGVGVSEG